MKLNHIHHIAIIASDYRKSLDFYTNVLGFELLSEHFRKESNSIKADLALNGTYVLELFCFPDPPKRVSQPEACGLRHLAFEVDSLEACITQLNTLGIAHENIRTDPYTGQRFMFFKDPDHLPIELYEHKN